MSNDDDQLSAIIYEDVAFFGAVSQLFASLVNRFGKHRRIVAFSEHFVCLSSDKFSLLQDGAREVASGGKAVLNKQVNAIKYAMLMSYMTLGRGNS